MLELCAVRTGIVDVGEDLVEKVIQALKRQKLQLEENDILALASKVISFSQGRIVKLSDVQPSKKAKNLAEQYSVKPELAELILREADTVCGGVKQAVLTLKNGILTANAGIDNKNAPVNSVVLWPENVVQWAALFRDAIEHRVDQKVGVVVVDSGLIPLRIGTVGLALAVAGFKPIKEYRGEKDLCGKRIVMTRQAVADDLACSAHLLMGESAEMVPVVLIRGASVDFCDGAFGCTDMMMPFKECIFMNAPVAHDG